MQAQQAAASKTAADHCRQAPSSVQMEPYLCARNKTQKPASGLAGATASPSPRGAIIAYKTEVLGQMAAQPQG